jgi:hypothetical protein
MDIGIDKKEQKQKPRPLGWGDANSPNLKRINLALQGGGSHGAFVSPQYQLIFPSVSLSDDSRAKDKWDTSSANLTIRRSSRKSRWVRPRLAKDVANFIERRNEWALLTALRPAQGLAKSRARRPEPWKLRWPAYSDGVSPARSLNATKIEKGCLSSRGATRPQVLDYRDLYLSQTFIAQAAHSAPRRCTLQRLLSTKTRIGRAPVSFSLWGISRRLKVVTKDETPGKPLALHYSGTSRWRLVDSWLQRSPFPRAHNEWTIR